MLAFYLSPTNWNNFLKFVFPLQCFYIYAYILSLVRSICFELTSIFVVQMKTGCVALVLCLNISVDPPDVIKISPCARMECWIGLLSPF